MDSERKRRIARQRGRELLEQPWRRAGLHEDDALKLAVEAQHEARQRPGATDRDRRRGGA